jgi:sec-independent protein translocase protein TatA
MPGLPEMIVVLVIILILIGPRRLGEAGRALGELVANIRHGVKEDADEADR